MTLKAYWRKIRPGILAPIVYRLALMIGKSLRLQTPGYEQYLHRPEPIIFAGWHGRSFIAPTLFRNRGYYVLVSLSRDGEMQNEIFSRFGFKTIRGSTGREGLKALVESIKVLKSGAKMALTPDGPRGPSGEVQEGILAMAQKSGALVVPVGVAANPCWIMHKSWDKYMVPKPFARAVMMFGDALTIPSNATKEELEQFRLRIEAEMHRTQAAAEALLDGS